jgi:arylsulfatase A-like enzyme
MNRLQIAITSIVLFVTAAARAAERPNVVFILADDLGYGDLSCMNADSKIKTPSIDRLAAEGMRFTDAHSASAVCTPTRYGILTGRYPWRTRMKSGVLGGFSPPLIEARRMTVASMLKAQGYHTACFGKWHLGMNWPGADRSDAIKAEPGGNVDFTKAIAGGPTAVGFDEYFGISASLDMPPFIFIHNDTTVGLPTVKKKWVREGPAAPDFEAVDVLPTITAKAVEYIGARAKEGKPFFMYFPLNAPHAPLVPSKEFAGKSGISPYADFVLQVDSTVGQVLDALEKNGVAKDTLIIFTSDNGFSPAGNLKLQLDHGHNPNYIFRGTKADIFEGGHHIPFVARWPGRVNAGSTCADVICLNDLMATAAEIVGAKIPDDAAEDSVSLLPDLLGTATKPVREATVHASIDGSLAIRQGKWKLELCAGSGGWSSPKTPKELAGLPAVQLYDMTQDVGERRNVAAEQTEVVDRLTALLQGYIDRGRSTPGAARKNDTATSLRMGKQKAGE